MRKVLDKMNIKRIRYDLSRLKIEMKRRNSTTNYVKPASDPDLVSVENDYLRNVPKNKVDIETLKNELGKDFPIDEEYTWLKALLNQHN